MTENRNEEFREFVTSRTERLRRFAYLCCGDWHRAEDVVQTALVRLYGAWRRVNRETMDSYVRRIIVDALIDEHRRAWFRRVRVTTTPPDRVVADTASGTDQRLLPREALLTLPARQRAAVVLRFWEDLPVEQTAQIMRCSPAGSSSTSRAGRASTRS